MATPEFDGAIALKALQKVGNDDIPTALGVGALEDKLLSRELITKKIYRKKGDEEERIKELMNYLKDSVNHDGKHFAWFLEVLEKGDHATVVSRDLASRLRTSYKELAESITSQRSVRSDHSGSGAGGLEPPPDETDSGSTTNGSVAATNEIEESNTGANLVPQKDVPNPPEYKCPQRMDIETQPVPFTPDLVQGVHIILMTVTDDEYCTVMEKTKPLNEGDQLVTDTTVTIEEDGNHVTSINIRLGRYGAYKVAIMQTEPGQTEIPIVLPKLLHHVKARYIISIGMGYGMNEKKQKFGDVLVSDCICDISLEHKGESGSQFQNKQYNVSKNRIFSKFKNKDGFKMKRFDDFVNVAVGSIVSRSTVVKDSEYKGDVLKQIPRALGGEMEGHAIVSVISSMNLPIPEVIVIKGIADWGDGDKEGSRIWQPFASHAAASYVLFHLKKYIGLGIEETVPEGDKEENDSGPQVNQMM